MASCEYCWDRAGGSDSRFDYKATLRQAEIEGWPCCERDTNGDLTEHAEMLRAGQFWDEERKVDRRSRTIPRTTPTTTGG